QPRRGAGNRRGPALHAGGAPGPARPRPQGHRRHRGRPAAGARRPGGAALTGFLDRPAPDPAPTVKPSQSPPAPLEIVVASANEAKIAEIAEIMAPLPVVLRTRADFTSWPEVEETGATYLDNALLKARSILEHTGLAALADDSGIEVDVLDGRPGPRSARLAGPQATDEANNVRLISLLHGVPPERRTARYRCVVVLLFPEGAEEGARRGVGRLVAEATCEGVI